MKALEERFLSKVKKTDKCWLWQGYILPDGHGQINRGRRGEGIARSHMIAYELYIGKIPDDLVLHHLCGVKNCVNPFHLKPLTREEHPSKHLKDACKSGHEYKEGGYIMYRGSRRCLICRNRWNNIYNERRKSYVSISC